MLNHITIMGRLTREPEIRHTTNAKVASFTVAVDRDFKSTATGERGTDFINCIAWRLTADFVEKYLHKGSMAAVSGRLQIRSYQDREGNNRTAAEVVAENIYFGEGKKSSENRAPAPAQTTFTDLGGDETGLPWSEIPFEMGAAEYSGDKLPY